MHLATIRGSFTFQTKGIVHFTPRFCDQLHHYWILRDHSYNHLLSLTAWEAPIRCFAISIHLWLSSKEASCSGINTLNWNRHILPIQFEKREFLQMFCIYLKHTQIHSFPLKGPLRHEQEVCLPFVPCNIKTCARTFCLMMVLHLLKKTKSADFGTLMFSLIKVVRYLFKLKSLFINESQRTFNSKIFFF